LRQLVVAEPEERIGDLMEPEVVSARTTEDQEEVARRVAHYNFVALPVIDDGRHLVGVVSVDDLMDVAEEEATEDMYRMVGLEAQETVLSPVGVALRRRVPWLLVNLMTAFLAALTVSAFQGTIGKVALLAVFMPVVAGHGGNTGTQVATLVVRGLALDEGRVSDLFHVIRKEIAFGLVHGALVGLLSGVLALILGGNGWLGLIVFVAMAGNVVLAGIVGSLFPLVLRTLRIDPALASAIWLTTFTDVMGFLMLLGMGALLIGQLT
jgi:magnesium transporter